MNMRKNIYKHREEAYLTCPETCWCWDADEEQNQ